MAEITRENVRATIQAVAAIGETIREAKRIPSGTLYAVLIGKLDLDSFKRIIASLKNAGLVEEKHNELIWIGPDLPAKDVLNA